MCKAPARQQMLLLWSEHQNGQHAWSMPGAPVTASDLGALPVRDMTFPPQGTCDCEEGASADSCSADGCVATPAGALGLAGILSCHLRRLQQQLTQVSLQAMGCQPGLRQCTQRTQ